jgi:hypothetical protein
MWMRDSLFWDRATSMLSRRMLAVWIFSRARTIVWKQVHVLLPPALLGGWFFGGEVKRSCGCECVGRSDGGGCSVEKEEEGGFCGCGCAERSPGMKSEMGAGVGAPMPNVLEMRWLTDESSSTAWPLPPL